MVLTLIYGDRGTGKTLLSTYLSLISGKEIFGNYTINSERFHMIEPDNLDDEYDYPTIWNIDEAMLWIDCRCSSSISNRYTSYIIAESRKTMKDYNLTMQIDNTVDLRWEKNADFKILCRRENDDKIKGDFIYDILKCSLVKPRIKEFKIPFNVAHFIWDKYNTKQRVKKDPNLKQKALWDKSVLLPECDIILANEPFSSIRAKDMTQSFCRNWCLENHKSTEMAKLLYDRKRSQSIKL